MKLANLGSQEPFIYAKKHGYGLFEVTQQAAEFADVARILNECIKQVQEKGCREFYIRQVHWHFHIVEDTHTWYVTVYGFI